MKLKTLVDSVPSLKYLSELKLKSTSSFRVGLSLKNIQVVLTSFDDTKRSVIDRFSKPVENKPNQFMIPHDKRLPYEREIRSLLQEKVPLKIARLSLEKDFHGMKLEPTSVYHLMNWLITIEKPISLPTTSLTNKDISEAYGSMLVLGARPFEMNKCKAVMSTLRAMQKVLDAHSEAMFATQLEHGFDSPKVKELNDSWLKETCEIPVATFKLKELEKEEIEPNVYANLTFLIEDLDTVELEDVNFDEE